MIKNAVLTSRIARKDASIVGIIKEEDDSAIFENGSFSLHSVFLVGEYSRHPVAVTTALDPKKIGMRRCVKIRGAILDNAIVIESKEEVSF